MKQLIHHWCGFGVAVLLGGCSLVETVPPVEGADEYVLACDQAGQDDMCAQKAAEACPDGYETLSAEQGFNRAELHIRCVAQR
ncbi:hypothetical protein N8H22_05220 [Stutzerimonas stutzeri]|uniref:hypothetical protein n=1 Tax=Stutzerimonas sp. S1 TaxID=3030652 RepID=UPI002224538D|nr:hypothetical protein [Stutzerimonas sp. S1]MCW3148005.1 hypothetical protein [Stutzerimonas sp. S1]